MSEETDSILELYEAIDTERAGDPFFKDTRVPVDYLWKYLAKGHDLEYFLEGYPTVKREYALAVLLGVGEWFAERLRAGERPI